MLDELKLEWLEASDYHLISRVFESEGCPVPDPKFSRILAAMTPDGAVAGFVVLQLVPHAEPIFVEPEFRNAGLATRIAQEMDSYLGALGLPGIYTQPSNRGAELLCERLGFEKRSQPLWVKIYDNNLRSLTPTPE